MTTSTAATAAGMTVGVVIVSRAMPAITARTAKVSIANWSVTTTLPYQLAARVATATTSAASTDDRRLNCAPTWPHNSPVSKSTMAHLAGQCVLSVTATDSAKLGTSRPDRSVRVRTTF